MAERYIVAGLARPRAPWFAELGGWANAGLTPIDFVKCLDVADLRTRLESTALSAVVIDASLLDSDRSLLEHASRASTAVLVVDDPDLDVNWRVAGAACALPPGFDSDMFQRSLAAVARPSLDISIDAASAATTPPASTHHWDGHVIAVCGVSGTGASTAAMGLAQGLADRPSNTGSVALADLALTADLAMYHDIRDDDLGIADLINAHRIGTDASGVIERARIATQRGYDLFTGLPRPGAWTTVSARPIEATLAALSGRYRWTIADVTAELDGEATTGSIDIEERHALARTTILAADATLIVTDSTLRGVRRTSRLLTEVAQLDVAADRVLVVVNQAPRARRRRSELTATFSAAAPPEAALRQTLVFLPGSRALELTHHVADPLPRTLCEPIANAVVAMIDRATSTPGTAASPTRVVAS